MSFFLDYVKKTCSTVCRFFLVPMSWFGAESTGGLGGLGGFSVGAQPTGGFGGLGGFGVGAQPTGFGEVKTRSFGGVKPRLRVLVFHGTETVLSGADVAAGRQRVIDAATNGYEKWVEEQAGRFWQVNSVELKHDIIPCDQGHILSCIINVIYQ